MSTLGQRIIQARRARGLLQKEVAEALGVTARTLSRWETDVWPPSRRHLRALADFFGKPVRWFTQGDVAEGQPTEPHPALDQFASMVAERLAGLGDIRVLGNIVLTDQEGAPPYPGVEALLADPALTGALAITAEERHLLRQGAQLAVGPSTVSEAVTLLQALRAMTCRRGPQRPRDVQEHAPHELASGDVEE